MDANGNPAQHVRSGRRPDIYSIYCRYIFLDILATYALNHLHYCPYAAPVPGVMVTNTISVSALVLHRKSRRWLPWSLEGGAYHVFTRRPACGVRRSLFAQAAAVPQSRARLQIPLVRLSRAPRLS